MQLQAVEDHNGNKYKMGQTLCESSMGISIPVFIENIECNGKLTEYNCAVRPSDLEVRVVFSNTEDRSQRGVVWLFGVKRIVLKGPTTVEKW